MTLLPHEEEIIGKAVRDITQVSIAPAAKSEVRRIIKDMLDEILRERDRFVKETIEGMKRKSLGKDQNGTELYVHGRNDMVYNHALDEILTRLYP